LAPSLTTLTATYSCGGESLLDRREPSLLSLPSFSLYDAFPPLCGQIEPDCLHYCIPGPLDIFAQVLLLKLMNGEV